MTQLGQLYEKETVQLSANVRKRLVILRMDKIKQSLHYRM